MLKLWVSLGVRGDKDVSTTFKRLEKEGEALEKQLSDVGDGMSDSAKKTETAAGRMVKSLTGVERKAKDLDGQNVTLNTELKGAGQVTQSLEAIKNRQKDLDRSRITLSTSLKGAKNVIGELTQLEGVSTRIDGDKVTLTAEVDGTEQGRTALASLQQAASRIDGDDIRMKAEVVGSAQAVGELAELNREADRVDGREVNLKVDRNSTGALNALGDALTRVATRMRALQTVSVAAVIPGLVAAIGAIPAIATPAVAALGALAAGMGAGLAGAAAVGVGALGTFGGALGLIATPITMLISKLTDYAKGTEKAAAAQDTIASKQQAYSDALNQVEDAERAAEDARDQLEQTTEQLTRAQQELVYAFEDEPTNLAQNELNLEKARDRLGDTTRAYNEAVAEYGPNSEEARDAALDLRQAELDLSQQTRDTQRVRENGSEQMQSALEGERSAMQSREEALKGVAAADRRVAAAQESASQALAEIAAAQQKAAAEVPPLTRAQLALYEAFLKFKGVAGDAFLPAQDQAAVLGQRILQLAGQAMPALGRASFATMQALTRAFGTIRAELMQPVEQAGFARFLAFIPRWVDVAAVAFGRLGIAMFNVFVHTLPYVMEFTNWLGQLGSKFLAFTRSAEGAQKINQFLAYSVMRAKELFAAIGNLAAGFWGLFAAFEQAGLVDQVWGGFVRLTEQFRQFTAAGSEGRASIVQFSTAAQPILSALWSLVEELVVQWFRVANAVMRMRDEMGRLVLPQALKDLQSALPIIGDLLIEAFRNFGPFIGPIIRGLAEFLKYAIALNPVLRAMTEGFAWILTKFSELSPGMKTAIASALSLRLAFAVIVPVLAALFSPFTRVLGLIGMGGGLAGIAPRTAMAIRGLGVAFTFATGPVGLIIAGLVALGAGLVYAYRNSETFRNIVNGVFTFLKTTAIAAVNALKNGVITGFNAIKTFTVQIFNGIKTYFIGFWRVIKGFFTANPRMMGQGLKMMWQGMFMVIKAIWGAVKAYFRLWWNSIKAFFRVSVQAIGMILKAAWAAIGAAAKAAWNGIKQFFIGWFRVMRDLWRSFWDAVKKIWRDSISAIDRIRKDFQAGIRRGWEWVRDFSIDIFTRTWDRVKEIWRGAIDRLTQLRKNMQAGIRTGWEWIQRFTRDAFNAIGESMWRPFERAWGQIKTWINQIIDLINPILKKVGINEIGHVGSGGNRGANEDSKTRNARRGGPVTGFARGGIYRADRGGVAGPGHMGLVGEAGEDEAIVNLERRTKESQEAAQQVMRSPNAPKRDSREHRRRGGQKPKGPVKADALGGTHHNVYDFIKRRADEVVGKFGGSWNTYTNHVTTSPANEHSTVDFWGSGGRGDPVGSSRGQAITDYIMSNLPKGLVNMAWAGQMWNAGGAYGPIPAPYEPHYDHNHTAWAPDPNAEIVSGGNGSGTGFNPLRAIFDRLWNATVQPVVDRFLKPMKSSNNVMTQAAGGLAAKVPEGIKQWALSKLGTSASQVTGNFSGDQKAVALEFAKNAKSRGIPGRLPVMTALQESGMRNLDYGDRDSLGYFQQRPSQGWGTPEQVRDPAYALGKFLDAAAPFKGQYSNTPTGLGAWAQAVQRSAFPDLYAQHWDAAAGLIGDPKYYEKGGKVPGKDGEVKGLLAHAGEIVLPQGVSDNFVKFTEWMRELVERIRGVRAGLRPAPPAGATRSENHLSGPGYSITHNGKVVPASASAGVGAGVINRGVINRGISGAGQNLNINVNTGAAELRKELQGLRQDNRQMAERLNNLVAAMPERTGEAVGKGVDTRIERNPSTQRSVSRAMTEERKRLKTVGG